MNHRQPLRLGATAVLLCTISHAALAQEATPAESYTLDPIYVRPAASGPKATANSYEFSPATADVAPVADAGALLASVPGVTISRMGGHGLDIVIRGQQGNQLNVIDAGSFTYGGCPNRMDPPTSMISLAQADRIVVERGYASVANGPGGSGGTVRIEREAPSFAPGKRANGTLSLDGSTNEGPRDAAGTFALDLGKGFYLQGTAEAKSAGNYKDGDGNTVRSAYRQTSQGLTFGYKDDRADLALDVVHDLTKDVLYAGAGMDSPRSENWVYRLRGGVNLDAGALKRIEGNLYYSTVDHVMDNYTLRPNMGMLMRVPTSSDTTGGKVEAQFELGRTKARLGIDYQSNERMAIAYGGMAMARAKIDASDPTVSVFLMWPDATIAQTGIYLQTETPLSERTTLKGGLRYDHVRASAGAAQGLPGYTAAAPDVFYMAQYGTTFDQARTENNVGGLLRLEHKLSAGTTVFAGLSRAVRTADANERAMARSNWVGNPDIAPEKHHQIDVGIETVRDSWSFNGAIYADHVDDYILRDQFSVPGMTLYRNVSADLAGVEMSGNWTRGDWQLAGDLTYTYGQNGTDDRSLAQIAPLMGKISVSYGKEAWRTGARVNWAAGQHRIDPSRDPGATPGYATLDLFASYRVSDKAVVVAGVDNVFDKAYWNHLSRANVFDPTLARVMEPGRTAYLKLQMRF